MKSRAQKQEELQKGKKLLTKSNFLLFADFSNVGAEEVRRLRRELKNIGAAFFVIKKRLLGLLLKEKGIATSVHESKAPVGTVFAPDIERSAESLFKFLKELGAEKEKILGGYDLGGRHALDANMIWMVGQLPPREVLLAQLAGMIAAPIRSLLYVLQEKSKRSSG